MKSYPTLAGAAALGLLLISGCNRASDPEKGEEAAAAASDDSPIQSAAGSVAETVEVAEVPVPASVSPVEAAPLVQAAAVAKTIDEASDIERVPYEGGWAWRRKGQIIRTASKDGRRVSYFQAGETSPFLVQQGDRSYSYLSGRVQRGYDDHGRTVPVDASRRHEGEQLARQSSEDRAQASRIAAEHPARVQREQPSRSVARRDAHTGSEHKSATDEKQDAVTSGGRTEGGNKLSGSENRPSDRARTPASGVRTGNSDGSGSVRTTDGTNVRREASKRPTPSAKERHRAPQMLQH